MKTNVKIISVPQVGIEYFHDDNKYAMLRDSGTGYYALYKNQDKAVYAPVTIYYKILEECLLHNEHLFPKSWFSTEEIVEHGDRFKLKNGNTVTDYGILVETIRGSNSFRAVITGNENNITFFGQPTLEELLRKIKKYVICDSLEIDN